MIYLKLEVHDTATYDFIDNENILKAENDFVNFSFEAEGTVHLQYVASSELDTSDTADSLPDWLRMISGLFMSEGSQGRIILFFPSHRESKIYKYKYTIICEKAIILEV